MAEFSDFDSLEVYKLAEELANWIYDLTSAFPDAEKFGLTSQSRRAAVSIAANIAEGYGRYFYKENRLLCFYARGSLAELKSHLLFSRKRGYISEEQLNEFKAKYRNLQVKLNNYIKSIGQKGSTFQY